VNTYAQQLRLVPAEATSASIASVRSESASDEQASLLILRAQVGKIFREIVGRESSETEYQTFVRWLACYQKESCQEKVYGAILLKSGYAGWMDIRVAELGGGNRFQQIYDWATAHGYAGGIPNFNQANYDPQGRGKFMVLSSCPTMLLSGRISLSLS
jgi:hypothetical protein